MDKSVALVTALALGMGVLAISQGAGASPAPGPAPGPQPGPGPGGEYPPVESTWYSTITGYHVTVKRNDYDAGVVIYWSVELALSESLSISEWNSLVSQGKLLRVVYE